MPATEHAQFDAICAPLEDFETLPTVKIDARSEDELEERDEALDELILAGLVAPY